MTTSSLVFLLAALPFTYSSASSVIDIGSTTAKVRLREDANPATLRFKGREWPKVESVKAALNHGFGLAICDSEGRSELSGEDTVKNAWWVNKEGTINMEGDLKTLFVTVQSMAGGKMFTWTACRHTTMAQLLGRMARSGLMFDGAILPDGLELSSVIPADYLAEDPQRRKILLLCPQGKTPLTVKYVVEGDRGKVRQGTVAVGNADTLEAIRTNIRTLFSISNVALIPICDASGHPVRDKIELSELATSSSGRASSPSYLQVTCPGGRLSSIVAVCPRSRLMDIEETAKTVCKIKLDSSLSLFVGKDLVTDEGWKPALAGSPNAVKLKIRVDTKSKGKERRKGSGKRSIAALVHGAFIGNLEKRPRLGVDLAIIAACTILIVLGVVFGCCSKKTEVQGFTLPASDRV